MYELALIYRDRGSETFDLMLAHYEGQCYDAGRERVVFYARCALLEDIAYGVRTGARRYAEAGLAHLARRAYDGGRPASRASISATLRASPRPR